MRVCCDLHAVECQGAGLKGLNFVFADYAGELGELESVTSEGLLKTLRSEIKQAACVAAVAASRV
jgi:hypothetical protein